MLTRKRYLVLIVAALLMLATLGSALPAGASSVEPVLIEGNPTCSDVCGGIELKVNGPDVSGTYYGDYGFEVDIEVTNTPMGQEIAWTSNYDVGCVVVKGGPDANLYSYDPPATGDDGLHSPINPSGKWAGLSHISFCYKPPLLVTKTVETYYEQTYDWTIDKSVTPDHWDLFCNDSGTSEYTVDVAKTLAAEDFEVSGTISVCNPTDDLTAYVTGVSDDVDGVTADVDCEWDFGSGPYELGPGDCLECSYSASLPNGDPRTNTATATTTEDGDVAGGSGTAAVVFGAPDEIIHDSITVDDTNGESWVFDDSGTETYTELFECTEEGCEGGTYENTAAITYDDETSGPSASASVTVDCYELDVSKDANTSYTREYFWDIEKTVSPAEWDLFCGDSGTSEYTIDVTRTYEDSFWAVTGNIYVYNPAPIPAIINSLSDVISDFGAVELDCDDIEFPYTLPAGETLTCSYSAYLPDATTRVNTVTVVQQNYDYDKDRVPTPDDTTTLTGTADVVFGDPTTVIHESITVDDTNGESWVFDDSGTETYTELFECSEEGCEGGTYENTATITYDDETEGPSASASVTVDCYQLDVSKDANTTYTREYFWDIEKTVSPDTWDLFCGDSGTSEYTVDVTRTSDDSGWAVGGEIHVYNPAPMAAEINSVTDVVSPDIAATAGNWEIDSVPVSFPVTLPADKTLDGTYETALPDATTRVNTATATLQNYDYDKDGEPTADGTTDFTGTADVIFGDPTTVIHESITVDDTNGYSWDFDDTGSETYTELFECGEGCEGGTYENIATITYDDETEGPWASASVTVDCYELDVSKDAHTEYTRTYFWDIAKTVDPAELTLAVGQVYDGPPVEYGISVWVTGHSDSGHGVWGTISICNPAPIPAVISSVSDAIPGVDPADLTLTCPAFPATIEPSECLECTYSAPLDGDDSLVNTATVVQQNYDYDPELTATPDGTTTFNPTADVIFDLDNPTYEIDECVDVTDSYEGYLGTACFGETLPKEFPYSRGEFPVYEVCGEYEIPNTAYLYLGDSGPFDPDDGLFEPSDEASATVLIHVPCEGCTLTQGYWKTHSEYGPAAHPDDTWYLLDSLGPDTLFFGSGQTYYEVLWTAPAGNAYYVLAHQYIGAQLNMLNGAAVPTEVSSAFEAATDWFEDHDPAYGENLKGRDKKQLTQWAATLDQYNSGLIGPGHCSE